MFSNFFKKEYKYIGFEDLLYAIKNKEKYLIINTLNNEEQNVLIQNSIHSSQEEEVINNYINNQQLSTKVIIVYGKNCCDKTTEEKYKKLETCGFKSVYIYRGGLFEWLMLQDIYGSSNFTTTIKELDILKYRPSKIFSDHLLSYEYDK